MEATEELTPKQPGGNAVGEFIRDKRAELGLSQRELGERLGKSQVWISFRERGESPLRGAEVQAVAQALGAEVAELRRLVEAQGRDGGNHDQPAPRAEPGTRSPAAKQAATVEAVYWPVAGVPVPIDNLDRDELRAAVRSLLRENKELAAAFEREMESLADVYESKVRSLQHLAAAALELEIREAVRDKMEVIVEAMAAEVRRRSTWLQGAEQEGISDNKEEADNGY
jgi:transcriptional regulator with XRE-family HTH domain